MLSVPLAARARGCAAATATVPLLSGKAMVLFCVGPVTRLQDTQGQLVRKRQPGGLAGRTCDAGLGWSEQFGVCLEQACLLMSDCLTRWWFVQCWLRLQVEKESSFG